MNKLNKPDHRAQRRRRTSPSGVAMIGKTVTLARRERRRPQRRRRRRQAERHGRAARRSASGIPCGDSPEGRQLMDPRLSPDGPRRRPARDDPGRPAGKPAPATRRPQFAESLGGELGIRFSAHAPRPAPEPRRLVRLGPAGPAPVGRRRRCRQGQPRGARAGRLRGHGRRRPNRTVVTALPHDEAGPAVFTNIDSAVIT